jgi:hypothetical protein
LFVLSGADSRVERAGLRHGLGPGFGFCLHSCA